jgi:hypothetical protein
MSDAPKRVFDVARVIDEEKAEYLDRRRRANGLPPLADEPKLWGLSLSGGGIRSATYCLGVIQAFMQAKRFRRFDYMSTVSGGGYIGSCLSSLYAGRQPNDNMTLDGDHSPFVGLDAKVEGYWPPEETRMSVRHQMHHLRSHGEYLIPHSGLLHRDFQRFVGVAGLGVFYTLLIFIVGITLLAGCLHLLFSAADPQLLHLAPAGGLELPKPRCAGDCDIAWYSRLTDILTGVSKAWWQQRFTPPLKEMVASLLGHPRDLGLVALVAFVWVSFWVRFLRRSAPALSLHPKTIGDDPPAGTTESEHLQTRLNGRYNLWSVALATALTVAIAACRSQLEGSYLGAFLLPLVFSSTGWIAAFVFMSVGDTWRDMRNKSRRPGEGLVLNPAEAQARRSLYDSLGGACLLGMALSIGVPVLSVLVFSLAQLPGKFFTAAVLGITGVWITWRRKATSIDTSRFVGPILDVVVALFLLLSVSWISNILLITTRGLGFDVARGSAVALLAGTAAMLLLGLLFDPNRISPQHFYSDRLAEAYLRTDARATTTTRDRGLPLVTLRDDEQLALRSLAENPMAPFHLIVAALNLSDSDELVRKRMRSDHFTYSGLHIGSRATGFVRTSLYRAGHTRLATAMAISAAAVASAAGLNTRRSVAFLATLFNARLGVWIENPGHYEKADPSRPLTFWPTKLLREILGLTRGNTRLVNVSDGAHTGDNLGLLPLLERRCDVIVACDAEADRNLDFDSFRNVVRMANVELNVTIDIDLTPVQRRRQLKEGYRLSEASVVEGTIHYPAMGDLPEAEGRLIYVKSSVSRASSVVAPPTPALGSSLSQPAEAVPPILRVLPAAVASYLRENSEFPHQTTADQFFDDGQFEAYRALGSFMGSLAASHLPEVP